ncbi:hypothetical protein [Streptomyces pseudovenezuelae]|uniref:Uncharacterized protein n=1 Tax=Streptomyces pseudovenezuelae TaxID=67350 RepID=A0ABT6LTI7_9ACTN|nr:hypothetical protein [Streptomyces pseudovenezuelae]
MHEQVQVVFFAVELDQVDLEVLADHPHDLRRSMEHDEEVMLPFWTDPSPRHWIVDSPKTWSTASLSSRAAGSGAPSSSVTKRWGRAEPPFPVTPAQFMPT